jgi:hypothetical protein
MFCLFTGIILQNVIDPLLAFPGAKRSLTQTESFLCSTSQWKGERSNETGASKGNQTRRRGDVSTAPLVVDSIEL